MQAARRGRTKRSHLGSRPSAGGIQDDSADAIVAVGSREGLGGRVWAPQWCACAREVFRSCEPLDGEMSCQPRLVRRSVNTPFFGGFPL